MEKPITDEELAQRVQGGDKESFGLLFDRYESKILRYGRRFLYSYEDVEDAVQDVFIKVYVNIASFSPDRKFSTWLYRIAHNTFINVIKKKGREPVKFFDFDTFFQFDLAGQTSLDREAILKDEENMVREAFADLSSKYREPIVLYYFEQKTYQEIADIMHIPVATVGVRLSRAREMIKKKFISSNPGYDQSP